ncbi:hypothetical protein QJS10_CPB15g00231 [Acorus calamus]|uniref:Uncharacterized protein n=1 Tax=Acorus calamus TaxID=4465 RepID=A0AAV9D689_ACOCL|nr:hypothetical protein QJS10_CPB15g00231 [Acorus calamus]
MLARSSVSDMSIAATSARKLTFEEPTESRRRRLRALAASGAGLSEGEATQGAASALASGEPHQTARTRRSGSPCIGGGDGCDFSSENSSFHQQEVPQLTASSRGLSEEEGEEAGSH